jgi:DNA-binding response OmpR family regulator
VLLTAKAQESDVRRGYDSGADAYIKKPFSPAELSQRVRALLDG